MALQSSGQISFSDIAVEALGVAYGTDQNLDFNDSRLRSLANRAYPLSIGTNNFYGKVGGKDQQIITVGSTWLNTNDGGAYGYRNFYPAGSYIGTINDGTVDFRNNASFISCYYTTGSKQIVLILSGYSYGNSGFTTIEIRPQYLTGSGSTTPVFFNYRSSATYSAGSYYNYTKWVWTGINSNPFGSTTQDKKLVILR
jgi:hypothetical protein